MWNKLIKYKTIVIWLINRKLDLSLLNTFSKFKCKMIYKTQNLTFSLKIYVVISTNFALIMNIKASTIK